MRRSFWIFWSALEILSIPLHAQLIPSFGEERVGTAIAVALKIPRSARMMGLNGAVVALSNDATIADVNPAGLLYGARLEAAFTTARWFAGSSHLVAMLVYRLNSDNAVGIGVARWGIEPIRVTTEVQPYGTGQWFVVEHFNGGISYAHRFTEQFTAGITVRGIYERLGEVAVRGVLMDLGTLYYTGFGTTRIALAIRNFGSPLRPTGVAPLYPFDSVTSFQSFAPPTTFQFGAATEIVHDSLQRLTVSLQFDHPADQAEQYAVAMEYGRQLVAGLPMQLILRAGYRINAPLSPWAAGVGITVLVSDRTIFRVDYALMRHRTFQWLHRLGVLVQWEP